jgi:hypothetical protein
MSGKRNSCLGVEFKFDILRSRTVKRALPTAEAETGGDKESRERSDVEAIRNPVTFLP